MMKTIEDWRAPATIIAAVIGAFALLWQQGRHWRETRRDKVREAYADWMAALSSARRAEERFLIHSILMFDAFEAQVATGDPLALRGAVRQNERQHLEGEAIKREIEATNIELDVTFSKVCLLDSDARRINAAEAVMRMGTLGRGGPGEQPSEKLFNESWSVKSRALGELSELINRSLALESYPSFLWEQIERREEERQAELHSRMNLTRDGRRKCN